MPMYDYHCKKCGDEFTTLVSWLKRDKVSCPQCGNKEVKRLISSFSVNSTSCDITRRSPFS